MPCLAVHAHVYQPDRREPATGEVPPEPAAVPYRDFNQKITAECYRPNAELGNFGRVSFDLGPTLGLWLDRHAPEVAAKIARQERDSSGPRGLGGAMAQPYHHTILPLATRAEKELEVDWGIADFEHRFGRKPRGLWLPETAADLESLRVLAQRGIEFTVLAPWQAADEEIDPTVPYWVELGAGARIAVFFFHRELSARLSFEPEATAEADRFAAELAEAVGGSEADGERLLLVASDGELYGHHQPFRDLFLERLTTRSARQAGLELTSLARFLDRVPPRRAVGLRVPGSWSCHHGVRRWQEACPCTPKARWKQPLRLSLEALAGRLDDGWERLAARWVTDPRELLRGYVQVLLGRAALTDLLADHLPATPSPTVVTRLSQLLESQRLRHRMFTSCGWFFDVADGLEPGFVLAAAGRSIELLEQAGGPSLGAEWLADLDRLEAAAEHKKAARRSLATATRIAS